MEGREGQGRKRSGVGGVSQSRAPLFVEKDDVSPVNYLIGHNVHDTLGYLTHLKQGNLLTYLILAAS